MLQVSCSRRPTILTARATTGCRLPKTFSRRPISLKRASNSQMTAPCPKTWLRSPSMASGGENALAFLAPVAPAWSVLGDAQASWPHHCRAWPPCADSSSSVKPPRSVERPPLRVGWMRAQRGETGQQSRTYRRQCRHTRHPRKMRRHTRHHPRTWTSRQHQETVAAACRGSYQLRRPHRTSRPARRPRSRRLRCRRHRKAMAAMPRRRHPRIPPPPFPSQRPSSPPPSRALRPRVCANRLRPISPSKTM